MNLRERAMQGSALTIAEYFVSNVLRLGSNLVLAYALYPEAFALVAYASIIVQGLQMFSDIGVGPAIVQSPRGEEPAFLNTAWTFQVVRGIVLFLGTVLLGWPMAWFYGEPQLAWIVPAAGFTFIVAGFQSTAVHTCSRALRLGRLTLLGLLETVLKAAITIGWALLWPSVWALLGGALISYTVFMVLTHIALPGIRNRFFWERDAARTLIHFGGWILISTSFTFLAAQADRLILGKLMSMAIVGVYGIALMFARLPYEVGSRLAAVVLFPAIAAVAKRERGAFRRKLLEARDPILAISQLGLVAVIVGAPWFFGFLYDARYSAAAVYAPLLAGTVWFSILWTSAYQALLAIGDTRSLAVSNFANFVCTVAGCILGFHLDEMRGFIIGVGLGNVAGHAVISWVLVRRGLSIFFQDLRYTGLVATVSLAAHGVPETVPALDNLPGRIALGSGALLVSAFFAHRQTKTLVHWAIAKLARRGEPPG